MEVKKGYDIEEVVDVIEMLADSQGFYGRLLEEILYIEENNPKQYEVFKNIIEKQEFKDPVDVVLFFEQQVESYTDSSFFATETSPIMENKLKEMFDMKQWGVFVTKAELNNMIKKIQKFGYNIFEVRELTMMEKLTYINDDIVLATGHPHIIMFEATDRGYQRLLRKLNLVSVF